MIAEFNDLLPTMGNVSSSVFSCDMMDDPFLVVMPIEFKTLAETDNWQHRMHIIENDGLKLSHGEKRDGTESINSKDHAILIE
jgi:hypothetical protein